MALGIPLPLAPDVAFGQGLKHGTDFYHQLVQHAIARAEERRAQEKLPYELKHMMGMESRANAAAARNAQARAEAHERYMAEKDPLYAAKRFKQQMEFMGQMGNEEHPQERVQPDDHEFNALREMMQRREIPQGRGAMRMPEEQESYNGMEAPAEMPSEHGKASSMLDFNKMNPIQKAWAAKMGLKPNAETPREKMQREIATANVKEQSKFDIKQAQKLRDQAKDLELAGLDVEGIHDLLTGPDSLGTGITKSLLGKFGWGSEKLGAFNERALRLQTQMTKALSSRGGEGAAKIVEKGKPTTWKSTSENIGITDAYADRIKNEFDLLNQEYKSLTGKNLPYTLPEYVHNIGKKITKSMGNNAKTDIVIEYGRDANGRLVPIKQGAR